MELLLSVDVSLDESTVVNDGTTEVRFLRFHGSGSSRFFHGTILPGGVDTQFCTDDKLTLSARSILEGTDYKGENCRIFIENNGCGTAAGLRTKPKIITDSDALKAVFDGDLYGEVGGENGKVIIKIYKNR